jgi:predicted metal-dependent hydrolase
VTSPDIPSPLADFLADFNRGAYWAAHESLEGAWRNTGSEFYHGLILYTSAWVHVERRNRSGVLAQLDKADPFLRRYQPGYLGIDLGALLSASEMLRTLALENRLPDATPPRLAIVPGLIRGTEPELVAPD